MNEKGGLLYMGWPIGPDHDGWEGYLRIERIQLAERADGKMARMIGRVLAGEDKEELELLAVDDQYMAQEGYVPLRRGDRVWHKHIDELTPEDRWPRIEYEQTLVRWLKERIQADKIAEQLSEPDSR